MTDQELTEYSAYARYGVKGQWFGGFYTIRAHTGFGMQEFTWNPLQVHSQAFELLSVHGISIERTLDQIHVYHPDHENWQAFHEMKADDEPKYVLARLITVVAAHIGKAIWSD